MLCGIKEKKVLYSVREFALDKNPSSSCSSLVLVLREKRN